MKVGIIGGSGLYDFGVGRKHQVSTPYGEPSGAITETTLGSHTLFFLPRHGQGHRLLPSEVNYRANVFALKRLGVSALLSVSAVGSLREDIAPGHLVLPDQYIDFTKGVRPSSFFGQGTVGHVAFADPTCHTLRDFYRDTARGLGLTVHCGGTYICIEGPQFSTRSESHFYRSIPVPNSRISVIGMTALPEAKLAREAGLCYQTLAMSTDYDCWNEKEEDVSAVNILEVLLKNVDNAKHWLEASFSETAAGPFPSCRSQCRELMTRAVVTKTEFWSPAAKEALSVVLN